MRAATWLALAPRWLLARDPQQAGGVRANHAVAGRIEPVDCRVRHVGRTGWEPILHDHNFGPGQAFTAGSFSPTSATTRARSLRAGCRLGHGCWKSGPGDGVVGAWLTANKGCQVVGVEYVPAAAAAAAEHFAHMIVGSIEDPQVQDAGRAAWPPMT